MRRPLLAIAALVLAGLVTGPALVSAAFATAAGAAAWGVVAVGASLRWRRMLLAALLGTSSFLAGAALAPRGETPRGPHLDRTPAPVVATLTERPALRGDGWRAEATLRWGDAAAPGIVAGTGAPALAAGDRVALLARVRPVRAPGNPGDPPPRTTAVVRASPVAGTPAVPVRAAGEPPAATHLDHGQRRAVAAVDRGLPPESASIVAAMLLGEPGRLEPELRATFSETGTAHLLAISGLHLGLIAAFALRLLDVALRRVPALVLRGRAGQAAAAGTIAICAAYTALSGAHVPTVRALVMVAVHLGARVIGRRSDAPTSLAVAALVLVVADPAVAGNLGFQLSFAAVGGLLVGARAGQTLVDRLPEGGPWRLLRPVALLAWTSTVAWIATGPLVLAHFGSLPLMAPLINVVAIPALAVLIMPLALVAVALATAFPPWAPTVLWPLDLVLRGLVLGLDAARPVALPAEGAVAWLALGATALAVLLSGAPVLRRRLVALRLRWLLGGATAASLGAAVLVGPTDSRPELLVAFLDVGHGDAAVIRLPDGTGIVVDGGGQHGDEGATGLRVVVPALRALGVSRLRAVVLTHPHADHMVGLLPVIAAMPPDELWWSGQVAPSATQLVIVAAAAAGGARIDPVGARSGARTVAGVTVEVLAPGGDHEDGTWDPALGLNEGSVVLRLTLGAVSFLLMGDAEVESERRMVAGGRLRPATVVKVGHHGSTTSSTPAFIEAVGAAHAVFSCDEANRHGLPKQEVLRRWSAAGARLHRTDHDGAVVFSTDGERLRVWHGR